MGILDLISFDQKTRDYVRNNESYNPNVCKDTKNIPTSGYGFNLKEPHVQKYIPADVLLGKRAFTQQEADSTYDKLYQQAVSDARQFVSPAIFTTLPDNVKQVIIDMSYNMGLPRLSKFQNMKAALQSGNFAKAREELLDSDYARKDVPARAQKNADILYQAPKNNVEVLWSPNNKDVRSDGSKKGTGFLGVLTRPDGGVSTELSVGVTLDGKEVEIPTLVPTLDKQEIQYLRYNDPKDPGIFKTPIGQRIMQKAIEHAKTRMKQGKSPFKEEGEK